MIQTDAQAALYSMLLGGGELQIELPLHVFVEQNAAPVSARECPCGGGLGVLVLLRPAFPVPDVRALLMNCLIKLRMDGEAMQQVAFSFDVFLQFSGARSAIAPLA